MGTISDIFLGGRADPSLPGWSQDYIDAIRDAGASVGKGKTWRFAKHDLKAMADGEIENSYRLKAPMAAINANKASSYTTADRVIRQNNAFEQNPASLTSAMLGEVSGQLDRNASNAFANVAAGAYGDAEHEMDARNNFVDTMHLDAAKAAAAAAQGFSYDRSRRGGALQSLVQQWLSPKGIGSIAGMAGGGGGAATGDPGNPFNIGTGGY